MRDGEPSATAQRVAAARLAFDRVPATYGDPSADERLARDVAGPAVLGSDGRMAHYLAARTSFFDRLVVGALDRAMNQVVVAAAGYDGRALRYAKPGVRWFELDHPDTQQDKVRRLERLGIDTSHVRFVPADFITDEIGPLLSSAGLDPGVPCLILCEGVAIYLDRPVLACLLRGLRGVAAAGSRLGLSLSVSTGSAELDSRRSEFQAAVAALGEPVRTVLTAEDAEGLLAATGWRAHPSAGSGADRTHRAGFIVAEPI